LLIDRCGIFRSGHEFLAPAPALQRVAVPPLSFFPPLPAHPFRFARGIQHALRPQIDTRVQFVRNEFLTTDLESDMMRRLSQRFPAPRAFIMRTLLAMTIAGAWLAMAGTAAAQDPARGAKVYTDQKCAVCHSIAGKGNAKGSLDDVGSRLKADEIREWMTDPAAMTKKTNAARKPPMRAYPDLARQDLDDLTAYMLSLKKK
jgi:mono/diheme cytochrome c family protein